MTNEPYYTPNYERQYDLELFSKKLLEVLVKIARRPVYTREKRSRNMRLWIESRMFEKSFYSMSKEFGISSCAIAYEVRKIDRYIRSYFRRNEFRDFIII